MKKLLLVCSSAVLLSSCMNETHVLRDVSAYKIRKNSLENHATVRVVYVGGGPSKAEAGLASGYQYLVEEQESGDTFRILCNQLYTIDFDLNYRYVSYFSADTMDFPVLAHDRTPAQKPPSVQQYYPDSERKKRPVVEMPGRIYSSVADSVLENRPFPTVFGTLQQFAARPVD